MKYKDFKRHKRGKPLFILLGTIAALVFASLPLSVPAANDFTHQNKINSLEYKQTHGFWETIELPEEFRMNAMHAATLPTGKVLLVAGSGNNETNFDSFSNDGKLAVLKTGIFDPDTKTVKIVSTPNDLFCGGHAQLQSGNLLVAGGTSGYEKAKNLVTKPAGAMTIRNEDPDSSERVLKKGTRFISPTGKKYISTTETVIRPAEKIDHGAGDVMIHPSTAKVFVEAAEPGESYVTDKYEQYRIEGLAGEDEQNMYGQGGPMTLEKQDFRGDNHAYEFDPFKEEYIKVGDLHESRWYPTLPVLKNGDVLAVSGLDEVGVITETTERYDPKAKQWSWGPSRPFPTYPALFRTINEDVLFYSGSNAGYGPIDKGRQPGFWNITDNSFRPALGLRDPSILETSGSVMLPPAKGSNDGSQSQRIMVAGGGGVGESPLATARTDIIDLAEPSPRFKPGPDLPTQLRYINLTVTPWDEIIASGGSEDYRAKGNSYSFSTFSIDPTSGQIQALAEEPVGRSYHSGSLLLQNGTIMTFGNDPLFSDDKNTIPGVFEQRIGIYTPPQLFKQDPKPSLKGADSSEVKRGQKLMYGSDNASQIATVRIIPFNSTTHVTNIEQRSVAAVVKSADDDVIIDVPTDDTLLPNGWYMLFGLDKNGTPARGKIIEITS